MNQFCLLALSLPPGLWLPLSSWQVHYAGFIRASVLARRMLVLGEGLEKLWHWMHRSTLSFPRGKCWDFFVHSLCPEWGVFNGIHQPQQLPLFSPRQLDWRGVGALDVQTKLFSPLGETGASGSRPSHTALHWVQSLRQEDGPHLPDAHGESQGAGDSD